MAETDGHATVLLTGFGPFGPHTVNPSGQLAEVLDGELVDGIRVVGRLLDASTATVADRLIEALDAVRPDALICLGLASGRPALSLERIAVNVRDFPIPDNDQTVVTDEPIVAGGADGMFTGLPIKAILSHCEKAGVPGHVSNTAGTYLCNQLFYLACVEGRARNIPAGFIHLPDTPQSAAAASAGVRATMEISTMERGIRIAITASVAGEVDIRRPAGAVA